MDVQTTIFISYRRTNTYIARSVYQALRERGFDVFMDTESLPPGDWKQALEANITSRAHFLPVLTPSALERCVNPDDILRFEIELAIQQRRNIVPLMFEGFEFGKVGHLLSPQMKLLPQYNGVRVPDDFFEAAIDRLCERFLNVPLDIVLHPPPASPPPAETLPAATPEQRQAEEAFERGVRAFNDGLTSQSITHFTRALELRPDYVDAYWERGSSHYSLSHNEAALDDWLDAARLGGGDARQHHFWSFIYLARGDSRRALEEAQRMIAQHPQDPLAYQCRADIYKDFGDYAAAIADYDAALRINPAYTVAHTNRGQCRLYLGDLDGAEADTNEAIRLNPNDVFAYQVRASVRFQQGHFDDALADYQEVLNRDPGSASALQGRGVVHYARGDYQAALADFERAVQSAPDDAMAYFNRANTYEQLGSAASAIADYRRYLSLAGDRDPETSAQARASIAALGS